MNNAAVLWVPIPTHEMGTGIGHLTGLHKMSLWLLSSPGQLC
jgi:hypothetical protein